MTLRVLVSYHYHRGTDLAALVAGLGGDVDLFADSGAYSAATTGATIGLGDYAAWLRDWDSLFTVKATLDVIGNHEATAASTARLRDSGFDVIPAFHAGEPWPVLEAMCARHRYVALGGLALHAAGGARYKQLMRWLIRAFQIGAAHGTVFHGFGVTSANLVRDLPFYSLDSSSYSFGPRFGLAYLWDAGPMKMRSLHFRNPAQVKPYAALFTRHGISPGRVLAPGFMRQPAAADRADMAAASVRAYQFMERSLAARHHVPAPPGLPRHAVPGTKIYLAIPGDQSSDLAPLQLALRTT